MSIRAEGKAIWTGDRMKTRKTWGGFKFLEVMVAEPAVWLPQIARVGGIWPCWLARCPHLLQGSARIFLLRWVEAGWAGRLAIEWLGWNWALRLSQVLPPEVWALGQGQGSSGEPTRSTTPGSLVDVWGRPLKMKHSISTHCFCFLEKLVLWSPGAVDLASWY